MEQDRLNSKCDNTMNANCEMVTAHGDDSDFESEVSNDSSSDTVNVSLSPRPNVIKYEKNADSIKTYGYNRVVYNKNCTYEDAYETDCHEELTGIWTNLRRDETSQAHMHNDLEEETTQNVRATALINHDDGENTNTAEESNMITDAINEGNYTLSEQLFSDISEGTTYTNDEQCVLENLKGSDNNLDDLEIDIAIGDCPGTVSINIVSTENDVLDKTENTEISDCFGKENMENESRMATDKHVLNRMFEAAIMAPVNADVNKARIPEIIDETSTCKIQATESVTAEPTAGIQQKEKGIIILSRRSPGKSRVSQSSPCLTESSKVRSAGPEKDDCHDTESPADVNDEMGYFNCAKSQSKRNQELSEHSVGMKRFKGPANLMVSKRQISTERGDFIHNSSCDRRREQKRSILDDVDDAIPRVIPKSGKQVKFGDEIRGSRLIQPSPEKHWPSEESSPNKAEKSILKKSILSDNCIAPQVFYNSSYVDEDSDGRDSGLAEDEDYRPWEYRDSRYESYNYSDYSMPVSQSNVTEPNNYYYMQYGIQPNYSVDQIRNGISRSPTHTYNYDTNAAILSGSPADREIHKDAEYSRDFCDDFYPRGNRNMRRSPGNGPWTVQPEAYAKENQFCLPTFDTSAFNSNKKMPLSKKHNSNKKNRREKKKLTKKRGKNETDIEKCQRLLSTGQVKLASTGNFDVRCIRLEYLLHIGDFSMKYKTEPGPLESMTLTIYTEVVSPSIDVGHLLRMQSNFINRLRFCLQKDNEFWLLHKFLPIGALQVLMNRDPYREVLGEVHAQFITAGLLIGIDYLHQNGIIHGNLYPWKVLINDRGYPVMTGFLPLVDSDDPVTSDLSERQRYIFSVPYAAPDRFIGDMHPGVDIFSIGCIAYEIVVGRTPFYGGSEERTKEYILSYSYRPVYDYDVFSFAGEMFIDSCLRKPFVHRFMPGRHHYNLYYEEWFSTLDLQRYEAQTLESPILDVIQLLHEEETLGLEERNLDYDWGKVMDIVSPHTPTLLY